MGLDRDNQQLIDKVSGSLTQAFQVIPRNGWIRVPNQLQAGIIEEEPNITSDFISFKIKDPIVSFVPYLATFKKTINLNESFDRLKKNKKYRMQQSDDIVMIDKKNIVFSHGDLFKIFIEVNIEDKDLMYSILCNNALAITGAGHKNPDDPGKWWIWILVPDQPLNFLTHNIWTINQVLTKKHYKTPNCSGFE